MDVALRRQRQTPFRHRWAADIPAQPFQLLALMGLGRHPGVQAEPRYLADGIAAVIIMNATATAIIVAQNVTLIIIIL
jgi:hypothetical protein